MATDQQHMSSATDAAADASPSVSCLSGGACPIDHTALSQKKTVHPTERLEGPRVERDAAGTWHIRGYTEARSVLRNTDTSQAGFRAELIRRVSGSGNVPILYQEGKVHQQQRKQTARFFTPKAVSSDYRQIMERLADELVARLKREKRADLSALTLSLAVRVAAEVIGLTNSRLPGMHRRLDAFFTDGAATQSRGIRPLIRSLLPQFNMAAFFFLDVQPAIQARKGQPREDVISHLLAQGYRDREILTECVTYGAAGMVTTREFISVATWHFLERPELRGRYLAASEAERQEMLQEILRLEPVVGHLYRRATADIPVEGDDGHTITIPQGDLIDLHIYAANADERVVGEQPLAVCPARPLRDERATSAMLGFGDGHHRCPGSYIALQETDIFLQRLLALDGLRMLRPPHLAWNDLVTGYELRDFPIALD
ncbi:MAG: cytochrome P450 [Ktedonobacterales bacterium]